MKGGERPPGHPPRRSPPGSTYWLIEKNRNDPTGVLTVGLAGGEKALSVFSFREEAELFLRLGVPGGGWWVRESGAGELVSVLSGPCANVEKVALDPLPEMVAEKTVGLVSLGRERFMDHITARGRSPGSAIQIGDRRCKKATEAEEATPTGSPPQTR